MPTRRATNNSVASLEDQTIFYRIMADQISTGHEGSSGKSGEKKSKSARKTRGDSGESTKKSAAQQQATSVTNTVTTSSSGGLGHNVATTSLATGEPSARDPVTVGGGQQATPPQGLAHAPLFYGAPVQQYPAFFPHQLQQQAMFPQFGQVLPYPDYARMEVNQEWEEGSVYSGVTDRPVHDMSEDDEDDEATCQVVSQEAQATPKGGVTAEASLDLMGLKPGKFAEVLKEKHLKAHEGEALGKDIDPTLASIIEGFLAESKQASELERICKEFPRVKNLPKLVVPKMDQELFGAVDQNARAADISLQTIQKAVVTAISALAPLGAYMLKTGESDPALDEFSPNMVNALHGLVLVFASLSAKRREQLKPLVQATYAKALSKGQEGSPEWLYGGNLSEVAKQCEIAKKVSEKLVKRKAPAQQQGNQQKQGQGQRKKFKQGQGKQQKQFGYQQANYMQYQQPQFPGFTYQYQAPYQSYKTRYPAQQQQQQGAGQQTQHQQQQQQQDFRPRGARK